MHTMEQVVNAFQDIMIQEKKLVLYVSILASYVKTVQPVALNVMVIILEH